MNASMRRNQTVFGLAVALCLGAMGAVWWWDRNYAGPAQLERRYLEAQQAIRTARADFFRAQQECRAQALEFGAVVGRSCSEGLQAHHQIALLEIRDAEKQIKHLENDHCPRANWCASHTSTAINSFLSEKP